MFQHVRSLLICIEMLIVMQSIEYNGSNVNTVSRSGAATIIHHYSSHYYRHSHPSTNILIILNITSSNIIRQISPMGPMGHDYIHTRQLENPYPFPEQGTQVLIFIPHFTTFYKATCLNQEETKSFLERLQPYGRYMMRKFNIICINFLNIP